MKSTALAPRALSELSNGHAAPPPPAYDSQLPATTSGLRALFGEALVGGVLLASRQASREDLRHWSEQILLYAAEAIPEFFEDGSAYRRVSLAALNEMVSMGYQARRAFEMAEQGEEPDEDTPVSFLGATLPPDPTWLGRLTAAAVVSIQKACALSQDPDMEPIFDDAPAEDGPTMGMPAFSFVDPAGVQNVRSHLLTDPRTGRFYQLILLRRGRETTLYRREDGSTEMVAVSSFDADAAAFLASACIEIDRSLSEQEDGELGDSGAAFQQRADIRYTH